ncbi:MAG: radical SAM protein [Desulfobulbaceae bacterium]|nr:radical SAM protein [Desulfobulbaceae bacterium]
MKLEEIGFYTLSDERVRVSSHTSDLERCELLITSKCNFKCPYCRGTDPSADITFEQACSIVDKWTDQGLKNIRFSGGEPTVVPWLLDLVKHTATKPSIEHIALSTNGSASLKLYGDLYKAGVNDFSISLDACCAESGDLMSGTKKTGTWHKVVSSIEFLSKLTYVTVGVVLTGETISNTLDIIKFADSLGVSDIRIIPAAQYDRNLEDFVLEGDILAKYPILAYRYRRMKRGLPVRGIYEGDASKCPLMLDDMVVKGNDHYPCVIKMREGCEPIGSMNGDFRRARRDYFLDHRTDTDHICKGNCLDVCVAHNNDWYKKF